MGQNTVTSAGKLPMISAGNATDPSDAPTALELELHQQAMATFSRELIEAENAIKTRQWSNPSLVKHFTPEQIQRFILKDRDTSAFEDAAANKPLAAKLRL
jgi:hypothetical protein